MELKNKCCQKEAILSLIRIQSSIFYLLIYVHFLQNNLFYVILCLFFTRWLYVKFRFSERLTKFEKINHLDISFKTSNLCGWFFQILWHFQNILTLMNIHPKIQKWKHLLQALHKGRCEQINKFAWNYNKAMNAWTQRTSWGRSLKLGICEGLGAGFCAGKLGKRARYISQVI